MFSEQFFLLFPHNHQETFTKHLTHDHLTFALHPQFMQNTLNFMYSILLYALCWTMLNITYTLWKMFPERSQKVKTATALTLWEPSENVLQTLCVSWEDILIW